MNHILVYADDMYVHGRSICDYLELLDQVLTRLENAGVAINLGGVGLGS